MMISYGEIQVWNRDCFAAEIPTLTRRSFGGVFFILHRAIHVTSLAGYALK